MATKVVNKQAAEQALAIANEHANMRGALEITGENLKTLQEVEIRDVATTYLKQGDVFSIPTNWTVRKEPTGSTDRYGNDTFVYYILLTNENTQEVIKFYPSCLAKAVQEYNEAVEPVLGNVFKSKGTAATLYQQFTNLYDGVQALAGKMMQVTDSQQVRTKRWGVKETTLTTVHTIDIINELQDLLQG